MKTGGGPDHHALADTIAGGKILQIDVIGEPARLRQLDLAVLDNS